MKIKGTCVTFVTVNLESTLNDELWNIGSSINYGAFHFKDILMLGDTHSIIHWQHIK